MIFFFVGVGLRFGRWFLWCGLKVLWSCCFRFVRECFCVMSLWFRVSFLVLKLRVSFIWLVICLMFVLGVMGVMDLVRSVWLDVFDVIIGSFIVMVFRIVLFRLFVFERLMNRLVVDRCVGSFLWEIGFVKWIVWLMVFGSCLICVWSCVL